MVYEEYLVVRFPSALLTASKLAFKVYKAGDLEERLPFEERRVPQKDPQGTSTARDTVGSRV